MKLPKRDVRRGFFDKVVREKHALVARMLSSPPIALPRFSPAVRATERLASTGVGAFVFVQRPDATTAIPTEEAAAAGAIFVATDAPFFGGNLDLLARIRTTAEQAGPSRPAIVQIDFVVHPIQISRAAAYGADAVVVHPALVEEAELAAIVAEARRVGVELVADVSTQEAADAARAAGVDALLVSGVDWDLLRARPLPVIDAGSTPVYVFEAPEDASLAGFTARVVTGALDPATA